ncbi:hypothetical protein TRVA0_013S01882 [Trichomonascus vanleenenianus]|uniref:phosphopantothenoylcysteine decarboxylase complex subunit CAB3 n=1 Tax=Trichomonascus vanleenenianus TaxID=2268995 RepID=UPI003EC97CA8
MVNPAPPLPIQSPLKKATVGTNQSPPLSDSRRPSTVSFSTSTSDATKRASGLRSRQASPTASSTNLHSQLHQHVATTTHAYASEQHPVHHQTASPQSEEDSSVVHILLAVTGSVATIKIPLIIAKLRQIYHDKAKIQLIVTSSAEHFMQGIKIPADVKVWKDADEWESRHTGRAESVLHVRLRRWADILLIAPLSANTLAKMANGICNNLITSVVRAWNPSTPILVAPAMNTHMYTNPMTKKHITMLKEECPWIEVLKPVEKVLVCGDIGMGGMREWTDVVETLVQRLGGPPDEDEEDEDASGQGGLDDEDEDDDDDDDDSNANDTNGAKGAHTRNLVH